MRSPLLLLPILSGVMWGTSGIFVRDLSDHGLDNFTIVFAREILAAVMILSVILLTDRDMLRIKRRDAWVFVVCGLSMVGINVFYTVSVDRVSLSLAAVLLGLSPVFMLIMARVIFKERITRRKLACMFASIVGCVLLSGVLESGSDVSASGIAAGLAASVCYALYGIMSKRAGSDGYGTYTILFYSLIISSLVVLPFSDLGAISDYVSDGPSYLAYLVFQAAVATFLPYILYNTAIARIEVGTASILAACGEPTAAAVFGILLFAEVPSPLMLLGMALAIASIAVMCMPSDRRHPESADAGE